MSIEIFANENRKRFSEDIKKWVILDTQIKMVNEKMRTIRETRHTLSDNICNYMKNNNITSKIEIVGNDQNGNKSGELYLYEKKESSPLTFSYIEKSLLEIINDEEKVQCIIKYLRENREVKIKSDLVIKNYLKRK